MNSVIEAQQEFEECQLRNRLQVLRDLKSSVKKYRLPESLLTCAGVVEKGPEVIVKGRRTWKL